ncbi:MAG: methyltransferase domain-containing protein [Alphaproteobacteria bacterium]|nr:methyltransferase domain-containing protein [Alphaproteobacteria bacterium]
MILYRTLIAAAAAVAIVLGGVMLNYATAQGGRPDVHFVPTPQQVVDRMLELAKIQPGDFLIDLGSGDGRIPITAAKRYGIKAMGIDIDPDRIKEANENAKKEGVTDKVSFKQANLFEEDISKANVITLYLLERLNAKLRLKLLSDLKPGSRVVSHAFSMGDWKPDTHELVDGRSVYLWTIPAKKAGAPVDRRGS